MTAARTPRPGVRSRGQFCAAVLALLGTSLLACGSSDDATVAPETLGFRASSGLFDSAAFDEAERWLGTDIYFTIQFTGRKDTQEMNGSVFGLLAADDADLPDYADDLTLSITVPLAFGESNARDKDGRSAVAANLNAVTAGEFDDAYLRVGQRLVEGGYGDAIIRLGHEFNGSWAPWSSRTNEDLYVAAWRHVHGVLRSVSHDFEFDWTATRPAWFEWGAAAYPGDEFVDIVGMDVYFRAQTQDGPWDSNLFEREFLRPMRDHRDFAESRGKPVSYPEWGMSGSDTPGFIEAMHDWLADMDADEPGGLRYHAYFDSGADFDLGQFPASEQRFRELFGS